MDKNLGHLKYEHTTCSTASIVDVPMREGMREGMLLPNENRWIAMDEKLAHRI